MYPKVSASSVFFLCTAESILILPCAFYLPKILDISHLVLSFSPCRFMCSFISFYFGGLLGGIRDNHLCSISQV